MTRARRAAAVALATAGLCLTTLAPFAAPAATAAGSDLTYARAEKFVEVGPGSSASGTATCPSGFIAVNGSFQVDSDHTGRAADLSITQSRRTAWDAWSATVSNGSPVRVTGRVRVTCLGATTTGGQTVGFATDQTDTDTFGDFESDGLGTTTAGCASSDIAVGSGWELSGGDAYLTSSATDGTSWSHVFEGAGASSVTTYVYCLTPTAGSGSSALTISTLADSAVAATTTTVADGRSVDSTSTCPEGSVAVAGTFSSLDGGVYALGAESAGRDSRQRFFNDSGFDSSITTDVVCLTSAAVPPAAKSITEDNNRVNKPVVAGKTFLSALVTCHNFSSSCGTIVGKAFKQNSDGSRGDRIATGKAKDAGANTPLRLQVSPGATGVAAGDKVVLVLSAGSTTSVIKDVVVD